MRHAPLVFALALAAPACAPQHGQDDHSHAAPAPAAAAAPAAPRTDGWLIRLDHDDRGSVADVAFTPMAPGWHVTTGPAALLHHPDSTASGSYRLDADIFLFDPGERREGYGVFFGGRDLTGAGPQYIYYLLRRDGKFLIKTRNGAETSVVRDWTEHPAIVGWENRPEGAPNAHNLMAVVIGASEVVFSVNGSEVARVARSELPSTDGAFGLRVNHGLNVHVTSVRATP